MNLTKYIGRTVTIIYLDRREQISQRRIAIRTVTDGRVRAYDLDKGAPRVFYADRILAVQLEARRA